MTDAGHQGTTPRKQDPYSDRVMRVVAILALLGPATCLLQTSARPPKPSRRNS